MIILTESPESIAQAPKLAQIAFESDRDGNREIYVMDVDGRNQTNLTKHPALDFYPDWSPDGTKIVFASDRVGDRFRHFQLYVMDADGQNVKRLTNSPLTDVYPAWSPDGRKIAFYRLGSLGGKRHGELDVVDADGKNLQMLLEDDTLEKEGPSWFPDGQKLVFVSLHDGAHEIYALDINSGNLTNLTNHPADDLNPAVSPDGKKIAFVSERDGGRDNLYIMDSDGKNPRKLPDSGFVPAWSPDGTKIAYYRFENLDGEIFVMNTNGRDIRNLTKHIGFDTHPTWFDPAFIHLTVSPLGRRPVTWGWLKKTVGK